MAREIESFSVWAPKNLHAELDIAWVQNYLYEKGEISLHGPVDLDRLIRAGVQLEKSDSGRNALRQLKAAYRTRKSRSAEERSSAGDIKPAEQNLPSQNKNHKTLIKLANEILKSEESLKQKSKTLESQKKELKERVSKSQKITQKALNKIEKIERTLNTLREKESHKSEIEKVILNNEETKGLLVDILNILDPRPIKSRPLRKSDITRHANRQKLKTKTPETPETPETKNKNPKSTPTTVLELINKINKQITD
ncbi:hypothetical protein DZA07_19800 [Pseudomonas aeruginosa]|uniref:hypothetical protein n=1 Tax=Pseudomonas aeruginosa TaxID=287 RepID=UPI000A899A44|nr:hypothetical protein [Pseudomonas aeruginosa]MBX5851595.1 hypothetical protein [Pseudomonas aeruginosa]MCG7079029.1 hypothetical protein [Pseudomonas aeruginosa]MCG7084291.1 hypothetical protein [Pseudomonas aeruginosa]MCG7092381.1 hypothetical protein [Pseudomonas aeruginosa]MCG7098538.1 hypothetical protein [Pseudomonas aeruginosa]